MPATKRKPTSSKSLATPSCSGSTIKLKVDGKLFEMGGSNPLLALTRFLNDSPEDELFTRRELATRTGVSPGWIKDDGIQLEPDRSVLHGGRLYFGHPKAIAEFKKLIGS